MSDAGSYADDFEDEYESDFEAASNDGSARVESARVESARVRAAFEASVCSAGAPAAPAGEPPLLPSAPKPGRRRRRVDERQEPERRDARRAQPDEREDMLKFHMPRGHARLPNVPPHTCADLREAQAQLGRAPSSWVQGFFFEPYGPVYGLRQEQGGPCSVVAAVQAWLILELMRAPAADFPYGVTDAARQAALRSAWASALWTCAARGANAPRVAKVVVPGPAPDVGLCYEFRDPDQLAAALDAGIARAWLAPRGKGLLFLVYSALLSRGVEQCRQDQDDPRQVFLGAHGYGTQELVNLLLTGTACSNVFDGEHVMPGGPDEPGLVLRGVARQAEVGFLSLFEHYRCTEVGAFLKSPRWPVWVLSAESHYSVAFAPSAPRPGLGALGLAQELPLRGHPQLEVCYFDPLSHDDEVRLTLSEAVPDGADRGMLENTLRTKWPAAAIDWHGRDPIL